MNILHQLIKELDREEIRFFKLLAARTNAGDERKDLQLLDHIRKAGESYDEDILVKKLYGHDDKNAFYRLKNRLLSDLNKSLSMQHYYDDEMIHTFHMLALVRNFQNRSKYQTAHYYLRKAELKARAIEHHELLDIIYGEYIKLSHELPHLDPKPYIEQRRENQILIRDERTIDDIVATLTYHLKISQNYANRPARMLALLQKTVDEFTQDKKLKRSPQLRFKIYGAVSQILLQNRDYANLESYIIKLYQEFKEERLFTKRNHDTKLQMLTYVVNALFKNKKFPQMLSYAAQLHEAMEEYEGFLYDKYFFFYNNALVIYYSEMDKNKAVEILHELQSDKRINANSYYQVFVLLNLAVINFDLQEYAKAIRHLNKLYLLDSFQSTDPALQFKIAVAELIIRCESHDYDQLEHKINRVKKDFSEFLKNEEFVSEKDLLSIIEDMLRLDKPGRDKSFKKKLKTFLRKELEIDSSDAEIISYSQWLKSRFNTL